MARDFKIELDNVEMINGSDDLLKDTKVTKVTLTGENKLNSLNSTFENCTELTAIEGDVNLDGVSDMTEMALNTPLDELKVTNPTEENIQTDNSLNQVTNVKIGGTKYTKGGVQDIVGSLEWNAENFTYEDTILDNVYTNSSSIEDNKNITVSDTLEQKATSIEITGQTYENLVNGKATENLLDEMSMQQTEGKPTQFTPHMEQPICLEYIEGQTYQNLVDGKGEETLISEYSPIINDFVPNTFKPPQNQLICLEYMEGETYQNLIKGKGEYKLTDTFSTTWTESNSIENAPSMIEIPEIFGNTVQGVGNIITAKNIVESINSAIFEDSSVNVSATLLDNNQLKMSREGLHNLKLSSVSSWVQLKSNTTYTVRCYYPAYKVFATPVIYLSNMTCIEFSNYDEYKTFTTDSTGKVLFFPNNYPTSPVEVFLAEGEPYSYKLRNKYEFDKYYSLNYIQSVGDLYVDESGEPILDEEGNEQYKLNIISHSRNLWDGKTYHKGRKQNNENWGAIDLGFTANWDLKEPYGIQYDITASSMKGPTIPLEGLKAGKYINLTFKVTMPQTNPIITVHFFDSNKAYIGNIFNRWDGEFSGNITDSGAYLGGLIPDGATCCEIVFALSQNTDDVPYPQHIEITDIMVTVDDNVITSYRECEYQESNKTTILMPCQLQRVKDTKDKLYWNYAENKYVIEKNIVDAQLDCRFGAHTEVYDSVMKSGVFIASSNIKDLKGEYFVAKGYTSIFDETNIPFNIFQKYAVIIVSLPLSVLSDSTIDAFNSYLSENPIYTYYVTNSPQTVETKILEKPSLETYSPKTYITTNTEIQPSQMTVINKEVKFIPISLQPSKSYTIQLDSVGKDNKPITVNLGGATTTIQPTNDTSKHHRVSITTPSSLTTDNLDLSGEGVIVNDVMLFEGNTSVIKQDVDYMDGIQSIGELFESRNLFDYTQSEVGLLDHTNGNISKDNSWKYTTDFVPVKPNTTYCISQTSGSVFNYKIVEYNSSKTYLKGTNWTSSKGTDINRAYNTFTTSANTYYLRLGWQVSIFEIQLEEDTFPTEFMAFDTVRYKLEIQTYDSTWDKL